MTKQTRQKVKKEKGLVYPEKYDRFIEFMSVPKPFRKAKFGFKFNFHNEESFAKVEGINRGTLAEWKKRSDYKERLDKGHFNWLVEMQPYVYAGMIKGSLSGNPAMVKLYLQYAKKWVEKSEVESTGSPYMAPKDAVDFEEEVKKEKAERKKAKEEKAKKEEKNNAKATK